MDGKISNSKKKIEYCLKLQRMLQHYANNEMWEELNQVSEKMVSFLNGYGDILLKEETAVLKDLENYNIQLKSYLKIKKQITERQMINFNQNKKGLGEYKISQLYGDAVK